MTACSGFLPDSTEKPSECIYHSRPGIETLYLRLPGVHVEDNRLLPLRYSHQPKSALKSPTLRTDRIHNSCLNEMKDKNLCRSHATSHHVIACPGSKTTGKKR